MQAAVELANRMGLPLVATSDVHYILREDAEAQDVLLCVNTGKFRTDANRMRMDSNEFYLRSPEEMYAAFPGQEEALRRSQQIADGVDIELELGERHFPVFNLPPSTTSQVYLRKLCLEGLKHRYAGDPRPLARRPTFPRGHGAAGSRVGRDREAGLSQLFSHRLGLRAFRPLAGHSGHGAWLGRGLAGLLCPAPEPRLPPGIRPALRAFPGREPPRGAGHRHRLLPAAPRRGDPVREGQVRGGERRPDRHLRHAGGAGGDTRRGPRPGPAHPAGGHRGGPGARGTENHPDRCAKRAAI